MHGVVRVTDDYAGSSVLLANARLEAVDGGERSMDCLSVSIVCADLWVQWIQQFALTGVGTLEMLTCA